MLDSFTIFPCSTKKYKGKEKWRDLISTKFPIKGRRKCKKSKLKEWRKMQASFLDLWKIRECFCLVDFLLPFSSSSSFAFVGDCVFLHLFGVKYLLPLFFAEVQVERRRGGEPLEDAMGVVEFFGCLLSLLRFLILCFKKKREDFRLLRIF